MLFNAKTTTLGFLIYIHRKNKTTLEISKCHIIKWWNVKKYTSSSGLASPRKTTDYSVKFFGIHFAICWHPIVKHIKQNKSNNMTSIKKVTNNKYILK